MIQAAFRPESLDVIPMGVYIVDRDGRVVHYNARALELWGRAPDPGQRFTGALALYSADGRPLEPQHTAIAQLLRDGQPRTDVEALVERADGSRRIVLASIGPLHDGDGNLVGAINCFQDITDRKAAAAELAESEQRFRGTFEQAATGMAHVGLDGRWLRVNQKLCDIVGYSREALLSRTFQDITHPDDLEADLAKVNDLLAGRIATHSMEKRYLRPDGGVVWVNLTVSLVRHEDGTSRYFIAVIEDIQNRKRQEAELLEAKHAAESASAAKDQFLATLSHELRTPLAPVLMSASAMERDETLPQHIREEFGIIRRNVDLEARLIDDLLDLTRVSRGKLELQREPVDAHELIREAVHTCCASDINTKRLEVKCDLAAREHHVSADPARLQQVLWNLLKNAVKFTPGGGRIDVATRAADGNLIITVTDNGMGIDSEVLPRLFDAFQQGGRDVTRRFGGLGLGLAIAKALVELHGGTIAVDSGGLGTGATFTIILATVAPPRQECDLVEAAAQARGGLRILLVEDHETTARVLGRLLRDHDYHVRTAPTLTAARALADAQQFDLLISDLGLPDGSGLELMRELAQRYQLKGIALSGYGMDDDIRRSREVGFATHLTKPVDFRKLQAAITQVTGK